jgi:hypothetical protein
MPLPNDKGECTCGGLARMADDPKDPVEFDPKLNEYHIPRQGNGGYSLVNFCPLCGGKAPASKRGSLFQRLDHAEQQRLFELTKDLHTAQDVVAALGEPDARRPLGMMVFATEKEGAPQTTQSYPMMIYSKLSDSADVHVTVYPTDKVGITFQSKAMLVKQTHEAHFIPNPKPPEPEPQIDTNRRYDIYCSEPGQTIVVYRNARFKEAGSLLTSPGVRGGFSQFVELEQANGQSVFVGRGSVFRFCEPGTQSQAEPILAKAKLPDAR